MESNVCAFMMSTGIMKTLRWLLVALCLVFGVGLTMLAQDIDRGKLLYPFCAACHGDRGQGIQILNSPRIDILPIWYIKKQLKNYNNIIRGFSPQDYFGVQMRLMMLYLTNTRDLEETVKYIGTFKPGLPVDSLNGVVDTRHEAFTLCQGCHGPGAVGTESLGGPRLTGQDGWYLRQQLRQFIKGDRGTQKGDKGGLMMRPVALTLTSDAAIDDIVNYITSLGSP